MCMVELVCKAEFNESNKRIQLAKKHFDDEPVNANESITHKDRVTRACFLTTFDNLIGIISIINIYL